MRQVYDVQPARICEAECPAIHKFVMGIGGPPFHVRKEVHHVSISAKHGHVLVTATVHPSTAGIWRHTGAALCGFPSGLVAACHCDFPSCSTIFISRGDRRFVRDPRRIVILVAIFFVELRNDPSRGLLPPPLIQHPPVQWPIPPLKTGHAKPQRRSILVPIIPWMTWRQVVIRIRLIKR